MEFLICILSVLIIALIFNAILSGLYLFFEKWQTRKRKEAITAEYIQFARDFAEADWVSLSEDEWQGFVNRAAELDLKMAKYQIDGSKVFALVTCHRDAIATLKNTDNEIIREEIFLTLVKNRKLLLSTLEKNNPR